MPFHLLENRAEKWGAERTAGLALLVWRGKYPPQAQLFKPFNISGWYLDLQWSSLPINPDLDLESELSIEVTDPFYPIMYELQTVSATS